MQKSIKEKIEGVFGAVMFGLVIGLIFMAGV